MKRLAFVFVATALAAGGSSPALGASPDVVISQVYGGGGNSGATLTNDFIELFNRGSEPVDLSGWSVQYASATGTTWQVTPLAGVIQPGRHHLVQEAAGAGGTTPLPAPDATGSIFMSATTGRVALVTNASALPCGTACHAAAGVRDHVGYGSSAVDFEGSGPAPTLSNTTAALRAAGGATDTDDNAADFAAGSPAPRNSGSEPPPPPPPSGCDAAPTHEIAQVQGSGSATPLNGQTVRVEGVVTGDFQASGGLGGFYMQDATSDADPATSDGLFVFTSSPVSAGDLVRVSGTAQESFGQTQLGSVTAADVCGDGSVAPTTYDLPVAAGSSLEPVEGMLLTFPEALTATEHFQLGRFGEITVSADGRLFQPTQLVAPGAGAQALLELAGRRRLLIDDGSNVQNPATVPFAAPGDVVRIGDTATGVTGVLGFGFSRYRLQPTQPIDFARANPRPEAPAAVGGDVRVASLNALNYFTTIDDGSNDARGADSATELERQRAKLVAALKGLDGDVVGLMEVENNGATAIADLVGALNDATAPGTYAFVEEPVLNEPNSFGGRFGTDAIKVAVIYRPEAVEPVGAARSSTDPVFDRPPLVQTFERAGGSERFTVAVNHFKSKNCGGATGGDLDQGDGQSCFNERRVAQASALASLLDTLGAPNPLVIGDLNAYGEEDPVTTLEDAGYTSLTERFVAEGDRYSFVFDGFSGELDHAMAGPGALDDVTGAAIWHINADEPLILDYNTEFNPPSLYEASAYRSSDHDPVVIGLDLCDVTAPAISVSASPDVLFPPNHKYVRVTADVSATDESGDDPQVELVSVTSDEPDDAPGPADGNTTGDVVVIGPRTFDLRAERDETGDGRVYTVTYRAIDGCGNRTTGTAEVMVPVRD